MSLLHTLSFGLALLAPAVLSTKAPTVGERAVEVARAAVTQRAQEHGIHVVIETVGRIPTLAGDGAGWGAINAEVPAERWLRPRLPVRVTLSPTTSGPATTVTVWFALSAPTTGTVYAKDFPRGTGAAQFDSRQGPIDLARTQGEPALDEAMPVTAGRLRHAVRAGEPVLASDWESVPVVQAQQRIGIEAVAGPVRLATQGVALADGDVGEVIAVLPDHAARPVQGRVVSHEVVRIER